MMETDIVLVAPVYNEEEVIEGSVRRLHAHMSDNIVGDWLIVIASNGSTDSTLDIAKRLSAELPRVQVMDIEVKGRGYALRKAWARYEAGVYAYCDIDLSTDIAHLSALIDSVRGGTDIAFGSRYKSSSRIKRKLGRLIVSKVFIFLAKAIVGTGISDIMCGFKAVSPRVRDEIVPKTTGDGWFFDVELLVFAERGGYRLDEVPVRWTKSPKSKLAIIDSALHMSLDLIRFRKRLKAYKPRD